MAGNLLSVAALNISLKREAGLAADAMLCSNATEALTKGDHATEAANAGVHLLDAAHQLVACINVHACLLIA